MRRTSWLIKMTAVVAGLSFPYGSGLKAADVTIGWDPPKVNIDGTYPSDVAGFKVHAGLSSSNYTDVFDVGMVTNATITNLKENTRFFFCVTAYGAASNDSPYSEEVVWTSPGTNAVLPNLAVDSIQLIPGGTVPALKPFSALVQISNRGSAASVSGKLRIWANMPASATAAKRATKTVVLGALAPGESRTFTISGLIAQVAGTNCFGAVVECGGIRGEKVDEQSYADNQATLLYRTRMLSGITITGPSALGEGEQASYMCAARWSDGLTEDVTSGVQWSTVSAYGAITPSGVLTARDTLSTDVVSRVSATFGGKASRLSVSIRNTLRPDFKITDISISPSSPMLSGGRFTAYVRVENTGKGGGEGGFLDVWADRPAEALPRQPGNKHVTVGLLAPMTNKLIIVPGLIAPKSNDTHVVRAFIDSFNTAAEEDESNNQTSLPYETRSVTNLVIDVGPSEVSDGTSTQYGCRAYFSDGTDADVTGQTVWSSDSGNARMSSLGVLTARELSADQRCTIGASYGGQACKLSIIVRND